MFCCTEVVLAAEVLVEGFEVSSRNQPQEKQIWSDWVGEVAIRNSNERGIPNLRSLHAQVLESTDAIFQMGDVHVQGERW